jgi:hypothetical protein
MTTPPVEPLPNPLFDRLTDLAACLCAQIEESGEPAVCFCGVVPGDGAVGDHAGDCEVACGMAWVRLVTTYPATGVGLPDETAGNCSASLGFDVEVGILRCIQIPSDGSAPPPAEMTESVRLQTADMMTMWRAIMCCDSLHTKDLRMNAYQPMGPMGGLFGGAFMIQSVL